MAKRAKRKPKRPAQKKADHGRILLVGGSGNSGKDAEATGNEIRAHSSEGRNVREDDRNSSFHGSDGIKAGTGWNSGSEGNRGSDGRQAATTPRDFGSGEEGNFDLSQVRSEEEVTRITYEVHLLEPHAKQKILIDSPCKRKIVRAGRRGGKTTAIAIYTVDRFLKGRRVLYTSPTTDQLGRWWKEVVASLAEPI